MSANISQGNKRIAKNTIVVYFRIFVTIIIGLLTSRYVLQALGASDYGLYNVVGGVIAMFTFISGSLSSTTTRFLNFEMGKSNGDVNRIFNISNTLHICFAIIILIICESIGIYYIINYLNVAPGKESDAMFVFQVSTIVACIGIINVPYQALFVTHEKFLTVAFVDIFNSILKLLVVLLLIIYKGNGLRFYAIGMSLMTFFSFFYYHYLAGKKWPETIKWKFVKGYSNYKEMLVFNNYNLLATGALVARSQGSNMLINLFFGTTVNAAYAIGNTVQNYVNTFVGNFDSAAAPQITQNFGSNNQNRSIDLASKVCRICILLMEIVYFPLMCELGFVLRLWLGDNVPEGTDIFCQCTLLVAVVSSTSGGITKLIDGVGKVKWFKIQFTIVYLLCVLFGYLGYKFGLPAYFIIILFVISDLISRINQLLLLRYYLKFDLKEFAINCFFRPIIVFGIMMLCILIYKQIIITTVIFKILGMLSICIITVMNTYFFGLKNNERKQIVDYIMRKIKF